MAARIRVYELARELGLTNKETLDLCESLGIGVKSHSSSIEDAQADRVRRKADRDGLRREVQPEEPVPAKRGAKKAAAAVTPPKPDDTIAAEAAEAPAARSPEHASRLVTSRPLSEQPDYDAEGDAEQRAHQLTGRGRIALGESRRDVARGRR